MGRKGEGGKHKRQKKTKKGGDKTEKGGKGQEKSKKRQKGRKRLDMAETWILAISLLPKFWQNSTLYPKMNPEMTSIIE